MTVNIQVSPALEVRIRLRVLHDTVHELASGFGADEQALRTIAKGIFERRLLAAVLVYYLNDADKVLGYFKLNINWARHQLHAESEEKRHIYVDPQQPISQQITQAFPLMVAHASRLRAQDTVKRVEVRYTYRDEIYQDPDQLSAARAFLGTEPGPERVWATTSLRSRDKHDFVRYRARSLDELELVMMQDESVRLSGTVLKDAHAW